jgi:glycosyltransferase involved in cell wall biosynthesis
VSTNAFGVDAAFEHGRHGWKCDAGDVQAFRSAIQNLLDRPEEARRMGEEARAHVIANYGIEVALARETALLRQLVRKRSAE